MKRIIASLKNSELTQKLLFLYIVLIPLMKITPFSSINKIQYSDLVFAVIFLLWFTQIVKGNKVAHRIEPLYPLFLVLLAFSLSFINSGNVLHSGIEFAGILYLVCMYYLVAQLVSSENMWWRLVEVWVALSAVLSITAIGAYVLSFFGIETFLLDKYGLLGFASHDLVYRAVSIFQHPGMFACYLHVSIIFGFILAVRLLPKRRSTSWVYISIILCVLAAYLTKARDNAGIMLSIFLVLAAFPLRTRLVSVMKYLSFLMAMALIVCVFFMTVWWILPVKVSRLPGTETVRVDINFTHQSYFIQQKAALDIAKSHPFIGVGMGMYNVKSAGYVKWSEAEGPYRMMYPGLTKKDEDIYKRGHDPHSTYLGWAAETGFIGLGSLLVFFVAFILYLRKKLRVENGCVKTIYRFFLAGFIGFLLNAFYIDIITMRHFWFFIAMAVAFGSIGRTCDTAGEAR